MMGDGVICSVFGGLDSVLVVDVAICSVRIACDSVSFFGVVGCRRAGSVGLVVGGSSRLAAVGLRGHSPAEGVGCLLLLAFFL